ncbi:RagB/SusD family nutrient uptake outer membrane protein [Bacteroides sp. 519]|uniref:RagB/SusD family nutrient uptake outer membrane protein n=1 Tax=Bacteroides sp. 519 TaxID=2302937 RepID=UPI0013D48591|nr:RagB/SusD family nutrient uptake outer membrane protein [Bacteroides sp. 519]NDV58263.1 RagB/SusD family nutrient uptake outer membrane protein [Bacteroides sp. 519]
MKTRKLLYMISVMALGLMSCEDFLDRPPLDFITDKEMSFSVTEMKLYSNKYYGSLPTFGNAHGLGIAGIDQSSDNMLSGNYAYDSRIAGTITVPTSGGGWDWGNIRGINFFLCNYHKTTEQRSLVNQYIGEMYFWRAWYYFSLMKKFGDLPWYDKPLETNSPELYAPRASRAEIANHIILDLDSAARLMSPMTHVEQGRLHRDAALVLQSRIALYEGTWEKYHQGTEFGVANADYDKFFKKAAEAAKKVMDGGLFAIQKADSEADNAYRSLFNKSDYSGFKDIMLWRKYDISLENFHYAQNTMVNSANTGISKSLVESYLCTDGKPISLSKLYRGDDYVDSLVLDRDPRLSQTIYTHKGILVYQNGTPFYYKVPELTLEDRLRNTTGYRLYKFYDPAANHNGKNDQGAIIFRYAEVLLNYAEAKAELNECTQEVLDATINQIRSRVNMPGLETNVGFEDPNWDFPELSPLLNEIRRERRVELACEGYRFDDLMRWAASHLIKRPMLGAKFQQFVEAKDDFQPALNPSAIAVQDGYIAPYLNSPAKDGWGFDPEKHYLAPLPINELTLNPELKQNPGY